LEDYAQALAMYDPYGVGQAFTGITQTLAGGPAEEINVDFTGLARQAMLDNGVVFACMLVRQLVFSAARFRWQRLRDGKPSDTFGTPELGLLERPWPGGTTQDLLSRMIQDADLAGNAFVTRDNTELVRLRPDWVDIAVVARARQGGVLGWQKIGYVYHEGGRHSKHEPVGLLPDEVCHFMPIPDPLASFRGMSWLTPVAREIQGDGLMNRHKRKFFENGASPNLVVKHDVGASPEKVERFAAMLAEKHGGVDNAYKTMNLYPGADVTVVGKDLRQIDFKSVQGAGETRIAAAAGVPPVIVGLSEGLQAATYSNYAQARRRFGDGTVHPLWQNVSGSMEPLLSLPGPDVRLWYDVDDVPFLREDAADAANISFTRAQTIRHYTDAGFTPESAVKAVMADDERLLVHSGLYSVQLRPAGADQTVPPVVGANGNTSNGVKVTTGA